MLLRKTKDSSSSQQLVVESVTSNVPEVVDEWANFGITPVEQDLKYESDLKSAYGAYSSFETVGSSPVAFGSAGVSAPRRLVGMADPPYDTIIGYDSSPSSPPYFDVTRVINVLPRFVPHIGVASEASPSGVLRRLVCIESSPSPLAGYIRLPNHVPVQYGVVQRISAQMCVNYQARVGLVPSLAKCGILMTPELREVLFSHLPLLDSTMNVASFNPASLPSPTPDVLAANPMRTASAVRDVMMFGLRAVDVIGRAAKHRWIIFGRMADPGSQVETLGFKLNSDSAAKVLLTIRDRSASYDGIMVSSSIKDPAMIGFKEVHGPSALLPDRIFVTSWNGKGLVATHVADKGPSYSRGVDLLSPIIGRAFTLRVNDNKRYVVDDFKFDGVFTLQSPWCPANFILKVVVNSVKVILGASCVPQ